MKVRNSGWLAFAAFLAAMGIVGGAQSAPRPSSDWQPATCRLWNESSSGSQMRLTMALWVRTYLTHQRGAKLPRGYTDRDLRRFLDAHCRDNAADNIQSAADVLGQTLASDPDANVR